MQPGTVTSHRIPRMLKATLDAWMEDKALRLSAALAYYSIFSIAPLLVIAISVAGLVLGEDAVRGQLEPQLRSYIGARAAEGVQSLVRSAAEPTSGKLGAIVGFAALLLGASGVFGQLKDALNTIWEVKLKPGGGIVTFLRDRLLTFGMVLIIGFLLLVSLLLTTAFAALYSYLEQLLGIPAFVSGVANFLVSFSVVTVLFALIFKVLPDAQIQWRNVWTGAAVTALLFEFGKFGLSFYLGRESTASSFGAAGSVVILLLWVYYASCILLFGAEFTQVYARETGAGILPAPNAVRITAAARAQEGLTSPAEDPPAPVCQALEPVANAPVRNPIGALLTVTGTAFVVGLLVRRRRAPETAPVAQIRECFSELGGQASRHLSELVAHARQRLRDGLPGAGRSR